jgi:hypothetical protein
VLVGYLANYNGYFGWKVVAVKGKSGVNPALRLKILANLTQATPE